MHACMEQKLCGLGYSQNLQQCCLETFSLPMYNKWRLKDKRSS